MPSRGSRLNRPDAANGMNDTMTRELADAAARCDTAETKVVILTGAGRFFCAGGDLSRSRQRPAAGATSRASPTICTAPSRHSRGWTPCVITAVNGAGGGAGFSLAVTGDLVLAAESASFTMAYTKAGLSPDGSASYYLPRLIGIAKTKELMLTNRTLSAEEASTVGAGHRGRARRQLAARADQLAEPDGRDRKRIQRRGQGAAAGDVLQRPGRADGAGGPVDRPARRIRRRARGSRRVPGQAQTRLRLLEGVLLGGEDAGGHLVGVLGCGAAQFVADSRRNA